MTDRFKIQKLSLVTIITMVNFNYVLALIPISLPAWFLIDLIDSPLLVIEGWSRHFLSIGSKRDDSPDGAVSVPPVGSQLLAYLAVALLGYAATYRLIPNIKVSFFIVIQKIV